MNGIKWINTDAKQAIPAPIMFSNMYALLLLCNTLIKLRKKAISRINTPKKPIQSEGFIIMIIWYKGSDLTNKIPAPVPITGAGILFVKY
jgi:hypothetical protein